MPTDWHNLLREHTRNHIRFKNTVTCNKDIRAVDIANNEVTIKAGSPLSARRVLLSELKRVGDCVFTEADDKEVNYSVPDYLTTDVTRYTSVSAS